MQEFYNEIGVQDVHSMHNRIPLKELDSTNINGSKPIDSIALSSGVIDFIEGAKLLGNKNVIITDHRAYMIDFNMEEYFQDQFSSFVGVNRALLNPSRKSHRNVFVEELENQLNTCNIEQQLLKPSLTCHEIEKVDECITTVLNVARVKVEGQ